MQKVVVWLGFWLAPMMATFSLAVSRALELANSSTGSIPLMHTPLALHLIFIAYPLCAIAGALAGAVYTNHLYSNLINNTKHTIGVLFAAAAKSATFTPAQTAAAVVANEGLIDQVGHRFSLFLRAFEVCFEVSLGFNIFSWGVCMAWSVPHLGRMWGLLYRRRGSGLPSLPPPRRAELRVAFVSAVGTVALLTVCSLAYSVEVIIAIASKTGEDGFVKLADTRQVGLPSFATAPYRPSPDSADAARWLTGALHSSWGSTFSPSRAFRCA